jgi:hypothetical protein
VTLLVEDLGGKVLWGSADPSGFGFFHVHAGESEVCEADVAACIDEDVLGFEAG